ncbi:PREDICTED: uncharacterized protein LOC106812203 [Priapulus caudatus]|uniref:Uncharacterized protein LOC106812203 n=1 Tax=Priapulus caudatus TaxID=37621 RepID=A0ABM1EH42_PRICU|nr:PREDICTED: uncharacterized protein LOC106812203 [Priapulus caudatus]
MKPKNIGIPLGDDHKTMRSVVTVRRAQASKCWCGRFKYVSDDMMLDHMIKCHVPTERSSIVRCVGGAGAVSVKKEEAAKETSILVSSDDDEEIGDDVNSVCHPLNYRTSLPLGDYEHLQLPQTRKSMQVCLVAETQTCDSAENSSFMPDIAQLNLIKHKLREDSAKTQVILDYGIFDETEVNVFFELHKAKEVKSKITKFRIWFDDKLFNKTQCEKPKGTKPRIITGI